MKQTLIKSILILAVTLFTTSCQTSQHDAASDSTSSDMINRDLQSSALATVKKTTARDLVLIYGGGTEKNQHWDPYAFHPYVVFQNEEGKYDWMFDGFLFLELCDDWDYSFTVGHGDKNKPAEKANWQTLIDKYFTKGLNIHSLDQAIDDATWSAGQPTSKRKVVIGIPEPLTEVGINWGMVDNVWLDFQYDFHKVSACQWFINEVEKRFQQENFRHLELDGFYWIGEAVADNHNVTLEVGKYLAAKKYSFTWIPWWKSPGYENPQKFGFSDTYLQPNYFFYDVPFSRLQMACDEAFINKTNLEVEFDDNALYFDDYRQKMHDYLDVYEKNNVYPSMKLAYYQAQNTVLKLYSYRDSHPHLGELYRKFCKIVTDRQKQVDPSYMKN